MMKKIALGLAFLSLTSYLLCACGKDTPLLNTVDYELDAETSATSRDIKIGDSYETFLTAYGNFDIFAAASDSSQDLLSETSTEKDSADTGRSLVPSYEFQPLNEIPADQILISVIPTFFIDGQPVDTDQFCEENEIEKADLVSYLTAESYLAGHKVIYRYLVFTWEDGIITGIRSESMDYNQDGSYYEAN